MEMRHFRPRDERSIYDQLLAVTQDRSLEEYNRSFVQRVAHMEGVSEEMFLAGYMRGLKKKVKGEVRVLGPRTLELTMDWASQI